jgi:hypothetical protein
MNMEDKVTLLAKRKSIQTILDYCMDNKILFAVTPREMMNDEFEIDLTISGIKPAVALGMFVKEHKFEVFGMGEFVKPKPQVNGTKKTEAKENGNHAENNVKEEPAASILNF